MDGGTLAAKRLSEWDPLVHGAIFRHDWGPTQDSEAGHWWLVSPVCDTARLSGDFTVTEHEDGTVSVYPSLVFDRPGQSGLHGYLNRSVWSWGAFDDRRYKGVTAEQRAAVYAEPPGEFASPGAEASAGTTAYDALATARGALLEHAGKCEAGNCKILDNGLRALDALHGGLNNTRSSGIEHVFAEDIDGVWHVRQDDFWDNDINAEVRAHAACGAGIWSCHVSSYPPILTDPKARHCRSCFPLGRKRRGR